MMHLLSRLARRFVAGETITQALPAVRALNQDSLLVSLDVLGEDVKNLSDAQQATQEYLDLLDSISKEKIQSDIAVKLSQLGLCMDVSFCKQQLRRIAAKAKQLQNFVWVDMEGSHLTSLTQDVFESIHSEFPNMGVAIQAALRRSLSDAQRLGARKVPVRICKGAYKEPSLVAFQNKEQIRENFKALVETFLQLGSQVGIATHDESLIRWAIQWVTQHKIPTSQFEFQMLYGLRRKRAKRISREGFQIRSYVPYGTHWLPYFMRRLRERKENVFFVLKSLVMD